MQAHDDHLVEQIEAYADQDYQRAHTMAMEAYLDIFDTAADLARGIQRNAREQAPAGGADTGGGGAAGRGSGHG